MLKKFVSLSLMFRIGAAEASGLVGADKKPNGAPSPLFPHMRECAQPICYV